MGGHQQQDPFNRKPIRARRGWQEVVREIHADVPGSSGGDDRTAPTPEDNQDRDTVKQALSGLRMITLHSHEGTDAGLRKISLR